MQRTRIVNAACGDFAAHARFQTMVLTLALISLLSGAVARGQDFAVFPVDDKARNDRNVAQNCFKDPNLYQAEKPKFDNYFDNFYFPSMTRIEPERLGELSKMREEMFGKRMLGAGSNSAAQKDFTAKAFAAMKKIAGTQNPPCHPAARYNAILIIGMLDDEYSDGKQPPKPLLDATKVLTSVVNSATTDNRFPPSVILGAIVGLERHAQYRQSLPPEPVNAMSAALVKLVTHEEPIQEMDRDAYAWLRLRAADALAKIGLVGEKNSVHDAIVKLASKGMSLDDRCTSAGLLEKLEYKDVKLDDAGTTDPLFALARDLAAAEDKRAQEIQDHQYAGGGLAASQFAGALPGGAGTAAPEIFPRRQVLSRLVDLRNGLKKVKPSLPEESQKKADAVLTPLNTAITALSNKDTVELTLLDTVRKMADAINEAIPGAEKAPAEKAAADDAAFK